MEEKKEEGVGEEKEEEEGEKSGEEEDRYRELEPYSHLFT